MRLRISVGVLVITLAACILCGVLCTNTMNAQAVDSMQTRLESQARVLSLTVNRNSEEDAIDALTMFAAQENERIARIAPDGSVLFDTRVKSGAQPVDLAQAPELTGALAYGQASHLEKDDDSSILYTAISLENGDLLRLSVNMEQALKNVSDRLFVIYRWLAIVPILAFVLAFVMGTALRGCHGKLKDAFSHIASGDYSYRAGAFMTDPDGLLKGFDAMAVQVENRWNGARHRTQAMNSVTNAMRSGIIAVDSDLRILLLNAAAKDMLGIKGVPEGRLLSETVRNVKLGDELTKGMDKGEMYSCEIAIPAPSGRGHKPLRLYISQLLDGGNIIGALALIEDVTEIKRLEQVRTDFAANVSHELRTPLTSIRGFLETLYGTDGDGALNDPKYAKRFIKIIMDETDRLKRLIEDVLSISRMESGEDEKLEMSELRIRDLVKDRCEFLKRRAEEKNIKLTCPPNMPDIRIWGNKDRVVQMLTNLIENAIKYTLNDGEVDVALYKDDTTAYFSVRDTGIGISEEHLGRLFERFYRVDKGRSREMGGTGLGLAICKHIVDSMHGNIQVHSKLGVGTEFLVCIPLYVKPADSQEETEN